MYIGARRSMQSAPRDGRLIILGNAKEVTAARWWPGSDTVEAGWISVSEFYDTVKAEDRAYDWWMELPQAMP